MHYTYDDVSGTLHPAPRPPLPKPGHWRIKPGAKPKPLRKSCAQAVNYLPANVQGVGTDINTVGASVRKRVRQAVADGLIRREDAPSWAKL